MLSTNMLKEMALKPKRDTGNILPLLGYLLICKAEVIYTNDQNKSAYYKSPSHNRLILLRLMIFSVS